MAPTSGRSRDPPATGAPTTGRSGAGGVHCRQPERVPDTRRVGERRVRSRAAVHRPRRGVQAAPAGARLHPGRTAGQHHRDQTTTSTTTTAPSTTTTVQRDGWRVAGRVQDRRQRQGARAVHPAGDAGRLSGHHRSAPAARRLGHPTAGPSRPFASPPPGPRAPRPGPNQPATIGAAATTTSGAGWREWSVAAAVQAMYPSGTNGFLIRDATEGGAGPRAPAAQEGEGPGQPAAARDHLRS